MGAYAPVTIELASLFATEGGSLPPSAPPGSPSRHGAIVARRAGSTIVDPTLRAMREAGAPFTGLLYLGLMLTADGPKVVEYNCRFGDPETQALALLLDASGFPLGMTMAWIAAGGRLPHRDTLGPSSMDGTVGHRTRPTAGTRPPSSETVHPVAVTTVLAAAGYPERPRTGDPITLPTELPDGVEIFHAGTAMDGEGRLVTAGGRVLAVTAIADSIEQAQALSRRVADAIHFEGKQYRADIGWREAERRRLP
jgi:phosphoribosylamine--glycine ligase